MYAVYLRFAIFRGEGIIYTGLDPSWCHSIDPYTSFLVEFRYGIGEEMIDSGL